MFSKPPPQANTNKHEWSFLFDYLFNNTGTFLQKKGYLIKINNRVSPAIPSTIIEKNKKAQPTVLMQSQVGKCVLTKSQGYSHLTFHHVFQCAIFLFVILSQYEIIQKKPSH